jgi:hypothetical protein
MNSNKHCIYNIGPHQVTPEFTLLFNPTDPAMLHCFAILEGNAIGQIFTDHPHQPTWGLVYEKASSRLYMGGDVYYPSLRKLLLRLRQHENIRIGMWPEDPRWQLLPRTADHTGFTLDFSNRQPHHAKVSGLVIPAGYELKPMDLSMFEHSAGKSHYLSLFGSSHQALMLGRGFCLTSSNMVLSEAFAGPSAHGTVEITASTHTNHREKGYATLTCAHLITDMEQQGYRTFCSCTSENSASIALARKLGYQTEREYRFMHWFKKVD